MSMGLCHGRVLPATHISFLTPGPWASCSCVRCVPLSPPSFSDRQLQTRVRTIPDPHCAPEGHCPPSDSGQSPPLNTWPIPTHKQGQDCLRGRGALSTSGPDPLSAANHPIVSNPNRSPPPHKKTYTWKMGGWVSGKMVGRDDR